MDRFEYLMTALRNLAQAPGLDPHERLLGADKAIRSYVHPYERIERQSELERIGEIALDEAAAQPRHADFWETVEDIASQLSLS